jgi:tetratricopeptide (TPR) repeat protein
LKRLLVLIIFMSIPARAQTIDAVRDRWTFILQHLVHQNIVAASNLLEDLRIFKSKHGIRDLFNEARLIDAIGQDALARDESKAALSFFRSARLLAPDSPLPYVHEIELFIQSPSELDDYAEFFSVLLKGMQVLTHDPPTAIRWAAETVYLLVIGFLVAMSLFALFLVIKYIPIATHHLNHVFGQHFHPAALVVLVFNLALLPMLITGSAALAASLVFIVAILIASRRERLWALLSLIALGIMPAAVHLLQTSLALPSSVPSKLYTCERGLCHPRTLDVLAEEAGDHLPWLLKVRGDYNLREFHGDSYVFESARESYAAAMKYEEVDPALWVNFANLFVAAIRYDPNRYGKDLLGQAMVLYDRAREVLGDDARVLYNKAQALQILGDDEKAKRLVRQALETNHELVYEKEKDRDKDQTGDQTRAFNHNVDLFALARPARQVYHAMLTLPPGAGRIKNVILGDLAVGSFAVTWLALVAMGLLAGLMRRDRPQVRFCTSCGNLICPTCSPDFASTDVCSVCFARNLRGRYMEAKEAMLNEIRMRRRANTRTLLSLLLNMALPGAGLMLRGRYLAGLIISSLSTFWLLLVLAIPSWITSPTLTRETTVDALPVLPTVAFIITYVIGQLLLLRKRRQPQEGAIKQGEA